MNTQGWIDETQWEELVVPDHATTEFECFCKTERISFTFLRTECGKAIYAVRDGRDRVKAEYYLIREYGDLEDPDTYNQFVWLMMEDDFPDISYEYEFPPR